MKRREEVDKYRDLPDEDLQAEAARLKESLFRLNFKLALGEIDAVKKMREEKKSLARLITTSSCWPIRARSARELSKILALAADSHSNFPSPSRFRPSKS